MVDSFSLDDDDSSTTFGGGSCLEEGSLDWRENVGAAATTGRLIDVSRRRDGCSLEDQNCGAAVVVVEILGGLRVVVTACNSCACTFWRSWAFSSL